MLTPSRLLIIDGCNVSVSAATDSVHTTSVLSVRAKAIVSILRQRGPKAPDQRYADSSAPIPEVTPISGFSW